MMRRSVLRCCRRLWSSLSAERVLQTLEGRGLVDQCTMVDASQHTPGSAVYVGFDPTADSLHTGNLMAIMALLHFRHAGYQPIAVVGGATGLVGDPSGRVKERDMLPHEALERNIAGITENLTRIFENEEQLHQRAGCPKLKILNNSDWWEGVGAVNFVSEIARHFRLSAMLRKESVKTRLQTVEGMSCAEFLYPIFQAYDFLQLHRHHSCWLQLGGRDQWGNITAGCDYIRKATGSIVHGLTLPLLTTAAGEKLGKSTGNAVWLSPEKTSSYELYQHFVRTADQEVETYLKYFTLLPREEIQEIVNEHERFPEKFKAQKCLAQHVTELVHGETGLQQALNATAVLFGDKTALSKLSGWELEQLFKDAPIAELPLQLLASGELTVEELVVRAGAVPSMYSAQSLQKSGGLYLNFVRVGSAGEVVSRERHLLTGDITIVRVGKKNYRLVKWK